MVNVFGSPYRRESVTNRILASHFRAADEARLAPVHVKKGEAQKRKLPCARPSQWVEWTEHSIHSPERHVYILHVRCHPAIFLDTGRRRGNFPQPQSQSALVLAPRRVYRNWCRSDHSIRRNSGNWHLRGLSIIPLTELL